jgi:sugar transferase (PEP-CTERM/EpsH1 system associated)
MSQQKPPLIAHIIYALTTGGLENGLVNIINRMPAGRYRHCIICITDYDEFAERITADNVQIISLHKRPGRDLRYYWRLLTTLWRLRPDIVHSRNLAALECQAFTLGLPGVKRVHGEHGREADDPEGLNPKYLRFRQFMRRIIHRYVAVSRDIEQWLHRHVGANEQCVQQIYNGVDTQRFSRNQSRAELPWREEVRSPVVIGTVGRLNPVKNQASLLHALAILKSSSPEVFGRLRLLIVGEGPCREELEALSRELELDDKLYLAGDRDDVPSLLAAMDIFTLPSVAEGISNTVLEAMASNLPVVATAVGGNVELVKPGDTGLLIPVNDHAALASALKTLATDAELRRKIGENAGKFVVNGFSWDKTVQQYLSVYDGLFTR